MKSGSLHLILVLVASSITNHSFASHNNGLNESSGECWLSAKSNNPYPIVTLSDATGREIFSVDPYRTGAGGGLASFLSLNPSLPCKLSNASCRIEYEQPGASGIYIFINGLRVEYFLTHNDRTREINVPKVDAVMKSLVQSGICQKL
jgi:hypothetical protein